MELIIVCVIIALILTVSIPTLRNTLYTDELTQTARKIVGTVREIRTLAVRKQQPYQLHFELDKGRIWFEPDDGQDHLEESADSGLTFPIGIRLSDVQAHSQDKTGLGSVTVWISKQGYMDQTVIHISDEDDRRLTLFFSPFSGATRVYEGHVDVE
jgi:Tfp pilus assembly protein FimT